MTDKSDDEIIEITLEEWELFCDIMSYILDSEFRSYGKNLDVNKYRAVNSQDLIQLSEEDARYYTNWLLKRGKDKNYLKQVLQEIAGCPPPTYESNGELWKEVKEVFNDKFITPAIETQFAEYIIQSETKLEMTHFSSLTIPKIIKASIIKGNETAEKKEEERKAKQKLEADNFEW